MDLQIDLTPSSYNGSVLEQVAMGLLNLYMQTPKDYGLDGYQVSVQDGKIIAGVRLEDTNAHNQMYTNGWYYDIEYAAYVYDLVGEDE